MNLFDIAVLLIIGISIYRGYRRGLIRTAFGMVSFFISLLLANRLYPLVSQILRGTALYDGIKETIIKSMGLKAFVNETSAKAQSELIQDLPLPEALRQSLAAYNTPDMYELLNVSTLEEYIGGYFANIALNALSMATVFALVWALMKLLGGGLDIMAKLPVISAFNRAGGLAIGLLTGLLIVWLGLALIHVLFVSPYHPEIFAALEESLIARWLYGNNWLFKMVAKI